MKRSCVRDVILENTTIKQVKLADGTTVRPSGEVKALVNWSGEMNDVKFLVLEEMPYSLI